MEAYKKRLKVINSNISLQLPAEFVGMDVEVVITPVQKKKSEGRVPPGVSFAGILAPNEGRVEETKKLRDEWER